MEIKNSLSLQNIRKDYSKKIFDINESDPDPFQQFRIWMEEAITSGILKSQLPCISLQFRKMESRREGLCS